MPSSLQVYTLNIFSFPIQSSFLKIIAKDWISGNYTIHRQVLEREATKEHLKMFPVNTLQKGKHGYSLSTSTNLYKFFKFIY